MANPNRRLIGYSNQAVLPRSQNAPLSPSLSKSCWIFVWSGRCQSWSRRPEYQLWASSQHVCIGITYPAVRFRRDNHASRWSFDL